MDDFKDAYRGALEELPEFHMDAEQAGDEIHHYKMRRQGRKYIIMKGCTAAAVFLLCGAGTVAAVNFRAATVKVSDNGFVITSENTQEPPQEQEGIPDIASFLKIGGVSSTEDAVPDGEAFDEIEVVEYEPQTEEYTSLEDFFTQSDAASLVPVLDRKLLGTEFTEEIVHVIDGGKRILITLSAEDRFFSMSQADNREYECYSSATAYMGESRNERSFTNSQGMNYVVIDSVDENETVLSVHAAISVGGRDLTLSFEGFDEGAVERILYGLDLSVYFRE